jgi:steroid Delta-isomerase
MTSAEDLEQVVRRYVERIAKARPEAVADLFAAHATVEDPVGTPVHTGRRAIVEHYANVAALRPISTELRWCRTAADTAMFQFDFRAGRGGRAAVSPIDVIVVNDEAQIVSLLAVWNAADDGQPRS